MTPTFFFQNIKAHIMKWFQNEIHHVKNSEKFQNGDFSEILTKIWFFQIQFDLLQGTLIRTEMLVRCFFNICELQTWKNEMWDAKNGHVKKIKFWTKFQWNHNFETFQNFSHGDVHSEFTSECELSHSGQKMSPK